MPAVKLAMQNLQTAASFLTDASYFFFIPVCSLALPIEIEMELIVLFPLLTDLT